MNKLRRSPSPNPFPAVDRETDHIKGKIPGNMMGYPASRTPASYPSISDESKNFGPKPLKDPTRAHRESPTPKLGGGK